MLWTVWYTHDDSTSHTLRLNRRAHLCWPLQWGSRRPWWRQLWPGPCPPPAWCAGATQSSGLLRGQRWGFWEAPSAIPSASGAGCSPAASRRTNADTATCNAEFVSDVWALVSTHQSVESYFQVTYFTIFFLHSMFNVLSIQIFISVLLLHQKQLFSDVMTIFRCA